MKKVLSILLVLVMLLGVLAGCGSSNGGGKSSGKRDDVIIYCEGVWATVDPHGTGCTTYVNMYLANQFYESLTYVADSGEVQPILATGWDISSDGICYTFHLRENVKFHNGEVMTADDVLYSYNRAMELGTLNTYTGPIDHVEAAGKDFKVYLKYAYAPFLSFTAFIPVVSQKFAEANDLSQVECGTGPYKLDNISLNTECNASSFADYWGGEPAIKKIKWKVITEGTTAMVALEAGELDFGYAYNVSTFKPVQEGGKMNTALLPTLHTAYFAINTSEPPYDNKLVRQAISYAVDRATMIQIAYEGLADEAYFQANRAAFGMTDEDWYNHYPYDLEKAKALLAEAGYPNGLDLGEIKMISGSYHEKYAQVLQESLSKIGVTCTLVASESAVADMKDGNYKMTTMGGGFMSDFGYTTAYYGAGNDFRWENKEVQDLFDQAAQETEPSKRLELYHKAIEIIADECPTIPIFNKQIPWIWAKGLKAVPHYDSGHPYYVKEWSWE